jgi:hypothetical protein
MKRVTRRAKSGKAVRSDRDVVPPGQDERLRALGLGPALYAPGLTGYLELETVPLAELLTRGLAVGDEHPLEGMILSIAREVDAIACLEEASTLGELFYHWAVRLRIAGEVARRYRVAT